MNSFVEDVPVEHLLRENTTAQVKKTMHGFSDGTWEKGSSQAGRHPRFLSTIIISEIPFCVSVT